MNNSMLFNLSRLNVRQIKRQIYSKLHSAFILSPKGQEQIVHAEIAGLLSNHEYAKIASSGVILESIDFRRLLELAMTVATARDIFWNLSTDRVKSMLDFKKSLAKLPLGLILPQGAKVGVRVDSFQSRLFHETELREIAERELETLGFVTMPFAKADQKLWLELRQNQLSWRLSLGGGKPLYQRGYRHPSASHGAPMPEHLARCLIRATRIQFGDQIFDEVIVPFAGSGTLGFESLLELAPWRGLAWPRRYAFTDWICTPQSSVAFYQKKLASSQSTPVQCKVWFIEIDPNHCTGLEATIGTFQQGLPLSSEDFSTHEADAFAWSYPHSASDKSAFVPLNPPFGDRLGLDDPREFYKKIAVFVQDLPFARTTGFCLCPDTGTRDAFCRALSQKSLITTKVMHGGKQLYNVMFDIDLRNPR